MNAESTEQRLKFYCIQCPVFFGDFSSLVKHYEKCHNPDSASYRILRDNITYSGADAGCKTATEYLGRPSSCLKCPFRKCTYDEPGSSTKRKRDEAVRVKIKAGIDIKEIALEFNVGKRTIQRIKRGERDVIAHQQTK